MKKSLISILALVLVLGALIPMAIPVAAQECPPPPECPTPPFEGLTPGFWKNHTDLWVGYSPNQTLESVFNIPDSYGLDNYTLLEALNFGGGPGLTGMARNLLRIAVAALLNAAHPEINYKATEANIISAVNAALASLWKPTMEALKNALDTWNNFGGGIDAHGNPI